MPRLVAALLLLVCFTARADEPAARRLFLAGNRELEQKRFSAALELYDRAWTEFPNPRILINRAAALVGLGRHAEAANTYARYLAQPDAEPQRVAVVRQELAALDARLGQLEIGVAEPGAIVVLDGTELGPSPQEIVVRVDPGRHELAARKPGYTQSQALVTIAAGERRALVLDLVRVAPAARPPIATPSTPVADLPVVTRRVARPASRRLALTLGTDVDGSFRGAAGTVGVAVRVGPTELSAAALLGPSPGGKLAATLCFGRARIAPLITAGVPLYVAESGLVLGVSAGAGVRWRASSRIAVSVLLSGQLHLVHEPDVVSSMLVPSALLSWSL